MSVIVEFSIFPMDKGESVSAYVARAVNKIRESALPHKLGPMGTCMEGEWNDVMGVVEHCFEELQKDCDRIYITIKADYRKGPSGRLEGKVSSLEKKL